MSLIRQAGQNVSTECDYSKQRRHLNSLRDKEEMIKLLSPHFNPNQVTRADREKYSYLFRKSVDNCSSLSPEKMDRMREARNNHLD